MIHDVTVSVREALDFASVGPEAAERLVADDVRLVGVDYLSVGGVETHRTLLEAGVTLIEEA